MKTFSSKRFNIFFNFLISFAKIFILVLCTFFLFRLSFLVFYGSKNNISGNILEILHAFIVGIRFDTTVALYGLLIPFLLILSTLFISAEKVKYHNFLKTFILYYCLFIFFIYIIISFIDFYFYKFFQFHINILFFGIVDDDTLSVLKSVWTDYPVIKISILLTIIMFGYYYILKKIVHKNYQNKFHNRYLQIIGIAFLCIAYFIGMRGSVTTFPLENEDSVISDNTFINNLTLNGPFALKTAISEKNKSTIDTNIKKRLNENGFNSPEEAVEAYLHLKTTGNEVESYLLQETPSNDFLAKNPPHVIFIQMESFGSYYLDLHSRSLNVLGKLEDELKNCIMFRNFLSATSGTIHTLESLMVGSPLTPISQSIYMDCPLSSSVALPFKKAGYHTNFVTSSELGWRNLDKFIPHQYFENTEGSEFLLKNIPNSSRCEWGVYDEFLFERMFQILAHAQKPQFIFSMTTTNHTPFSLPKEYKPYPVSIPDNMAHRLRTDKGIAVKNFTNYQYANDCLGKFIEKIRKSPLGENTIIAASGDHNTLQLFSFGDKHLLDKFSVPFILYIPEKYKPHISVNLKKFGSHKDIFPTLFHLALSKTQYVKTGNNLLDSITTPYFGIINYNVAMNDMGCVFLTEPSYFKWTDGTKKHLQPTTLEQSPDLKELLKNAKSYKASMSFYIQSDLKKCKK